MSDEPENPMNPAIDQMWIVYQRFKSLGASEAEAAALAATFMQSAVAITQAIRQNR